MPFNIVVPRLFVGQGSNVQAAGASQSTQQLYQPIQQQYQGNQQLQPNIQQYQPNQQLQPNIQQYQPTQQPNQQQLQPDIQQFQPNQQPYAATPGGYALPPTQPQPLFLGQTLQQGNVPQQGGVSFVSPAAPQYIVSSAPPQYLVSTPTTPIAGPGQVFLTATPDGMTTQPVMYSTPVSPAAGNDCRLIGELDYIELSGSLHMNEDILRLFCNLKNVLWKETMVHLAAVTPMYSRTPDERPPSPTTIPLIRPHFVWRTVVSVRIRIPHERPSLLYDHTHVILRVVV